MNCLTTQLSPRIVTSIWKPGILYMWSLLVVQGRSWGSNGAIIIQGKL
jgi:hypothetical protein